MKISNADFIAKIRDPKFYLENFTKIKGKNAGSLIPFILSEAQKDILNVLRRNNRLMVLKARQVGISTIIVGYFYHQSITVPGTNTALIGYNSEVTKEFIEKIKTFCRTTPKALRPTIKYNTRDEISFPSLDSKIFILPSTEYVGRGYTLHQVLGTEFPQWKDAEEKMQSLEASVPINGKLVIESTPAGFGDKFHQMWVSKNDYIKKKYDWRWGYSLKEIEIIRRRINDPRIFTQEYCCKFLESGRSVFDQKIIEEQRKNILDVGAERTFEDNTKFKVYEKDGLRIYREPEININYVCGVDTSEGVTGGDPSGVVFWNRRTGEEAAMFRGILAPDRLATKLNEWGRWYNNALMVIETNNHGLVTLTELKKLIYPSFYFRLGHLDGINYQSTNRLGWKTNWVTRPLLIDDFAKAVREKSVIIHSKELLDEMTVMVYDDNNNMVVPKGFHDDLIFAAGIGLQGFKMVSSAPLEQINYEKFMPSSFTY